MSTSASPKKRAAAKPKVPASHPTYQAMIKAAISSLKERGGSSRAAILKYILAHYKVGDNVKSINGHLRLALRRGVSSGALAQVKGTGASGSFKLSDSAKVAKPKKAAPKKKASPKKKKAAAAPAPAEGEEAPKKKAAAKPKAKKSPKKPAAKKSPKKAAAKKSPKKAKATPKKAAAKPKTKKSPKKKAAAKK